MIKQAAINWSNHKCPTLGAAIAYYSIFSLGPVIVISTAIAGVIFGQDAAHGEIAEQIRNLLGDSASQALMALLAASRHPWQGVWQTAFGLATLLFAAVGVVVQLKDALNTVWEVDQPRGSGVWHMVRTYLVSLAGILSLGFLLLVSLIFTAALAAVGKFIAPHLPETSLQVAGSGASFGLITVLFAMMLKWLPDTPVSWRDVWFGAALTAALFEIGKFLIAFYIGKEGLQSTYGAATSLIMLLIWVYYSSQIVLVGAEFTHVHAQRRAARVGACHAVPANAVVPQ